MGKYNYKKTNILLKRIYVNFRINISSILQQTYLACHDNLSNTFNDITCSLPFENFDFTVFLTPSLQI